MKIEETAYLTKLASEYYVSIDKPLKTKSSKPRYVMSFEEHCEDIIDQHIGLLSGKALDDARSGYEQMINE